MNARAKATQKSHLFFCTQPTTVALPSANVLRVVRAAEWKGEIPLALSVLVPIVFSATEPEWVVELGIASEAIPTLVKGRVHIESLPSDALLPMPLGQHRGFRTFSEVVLADGLPSALVINIDELLDKHRELGG